MKAKEYFQKFVANTPKQVNYTLFCKIVSDTFNVMYEELRLVFEPLKQEASKLAKVREFDKKWIAFMHMVEEHYKAPELYRRPSGHDDGIIDNTDIETASMLFMWYIKDQYPLIHRRLQETLVAPDRRRVEQRPISHTDPDAFYRLVKAFRGF